MIVLDATIVNVALPSIAADLRFSAGDLSWVVNAYLVAFGGLLLLAGRMGDLVGQRRVFLAGLGVFVAASSRARSRPRPGCWSARGWCRASAGPSPPRSCWG
ncbi:MAG: MFS transporter [Nocardioides sp.]